MMVLMTVFLSLLLPGLIVIYQIMTKTYEELENIIQQDKKSYYVLQKSIKEN